MTQTHQSGPYDQIPDEFDAAEAERRYGGYNGSTAYGTPQSLPQLHPGISPNDHLTRGRPTTPLPANATPFVPRLPVPRHQGGIASNTLLNPPQPEHQGASGSQPMLGPPRRPARVQRTEPVVPQPRMLTLRRSVRTISDLQRDRKSAHGSEPSTGGAQQPAGPVGTNQVPQGAVLAQPSQPHQPAEPARAEGQPLQPGEPAHGANQPQPFAVHAQQYVYARLPEHPPLDQEPFQSLLCYMPPLMPDRPLRMDFLLAPYPPPGVAQPSDVEAQEAQPMPASLRNIPAERSDFREAHSLPVSFKQQPPLPPPSSCYRPTNSADENVASWRETVGAVAGSIPPAERVKWERMVEGVVEDPTSRQYSVNRTTRRAFESERRAGSARGTGQRSAAPPFAPGSLYAAADKTLALHAGWPAGDHTDGRRSHLARTISYNSADGSPSRAPASGMHSRAGMVPELSEADSDTPPPTHSPVTPSDPLVHDALLPPTVQNAANDDIVEFGEILQAHRGRRVSQTAQPVAGPSRQPAGPHHAPTLSRRSSEAGSVSQMSPMAAEHIPPDLMYALNKDPTPSIYIESVFGDSSPTLDMLRGDVYYCNMKLSRMLQRLGVPDSTPHAGVDVALHTANSIGSLQKTIGSLGDTCSVILEHPQENWTFEERIWSERQYAYIHSIQRNIYRLCALVDHVDTSADLAHVNNKIQQFNSKFRDTAQRLILSAQILRNHRDTVNIAMTNAEARAREKGKQTNARAEEMQEHNMSNLRDRDRREWINLPLAYKNATL